MKRRNILPDDFEYEEGENKTDSSGDQYDQYIHYLDYMWEKMIAKDRPDLTPKDDEYKALKAQTYKAWNEHSLNLEKQNSRAMKWVAGLNKIRVADWDKDLEWMNTEKAEAVFSYLGSTFLTTCCDKLGINYESLTIEMKLAATTMVKDYTSTIAWIAKNAEKVEQENPYR
tara:strand:- start:183 stop:695 length:513 start_codon:yes stop_codon:yes gene_type:complete